MNQRRAGVTVAAALGAGLMAAAGLWGCGDSGPTAEEHLQKAREYIAKTDLRASVIELQNAIQKDPKRAEARVLLGTAHLKLGDAVSAEKELTRARDLGASPDTYVLPLADAWLAQRQFQKVLDQVPLDEAAPAARQGAVLLARSKARFGLNDAEAGERDLDDAHALDPDNPRVLAVLAGLAQSREDLASAQALIDRAKRIAPDDPDVLAMAGSIAGARNDRAQAVLEYKALVAANPDNPSYPLALAEAQIANGEVDPAIETVDAVLKRYPRQPYAHFLRGLAAYQKQDFASAKEHMQVMASAAPDHLPTIQVMGGTHFALGEDEQAIDRLTVVTARAPENVPARRMLAAALLRTGDAEKAREVLGPLEAGAADDAHLLAMIGTAALRTGDLRSGERYFERLTELQPDNAAARAQLGTIRISLDEVQQGTLDLERSIEQDPSIVSLATLAVTHIRAGEFDKALEVAGRLREQFPENPSGATLAGIAHGGKGDPAAARAAFRRALAIQPGAPDASANLAVLELREGNATEALAILREALKQNPDHLPTLLRVAQLEHQTGEAAQARERLNAYIATHRDALAPRIALAQLHLRDGEAQPALDLVEGVLARNPDNAALLAIVGQGQLAAGRPADAARVLKQLVEKQPGSADAHYLLARAYLATGDQAGYRIELEKTLEIAPDRLPAKLELAGVAVQQGDMTTAKRLAGEMTATAPEDPGVIELEGVIAFRENRPADAVEHFKKAAEMRPRADAVLRLAEAQRLAGDPEGSRETLRNWIGEHPDDVRVRVAFGTWELQDERYDAAKEQFAAIVETEPDNVLALNNVAWLLWNEGDAAGALPHAERAVELAPDNAAVLDTAGIVHLKLGNTGRALTLLQKAWIKLPDNAEVQYHYAQALVAQGKTDEARGVLRQALSKGTDFRGGTEAEALLKELGG
jgi:putative PEP-CTERM system TPR-repeat lipoprotein